MLIPMRFCQRDVYDVQELLFVGCIELAIGLVLLGVDEVCAGARVDC